MSKPKMYCWHELSCGCRMWSTEDVYPGDPQTCMNHGEQTVKKWHRQNYKKVKDLEWVG